MIDPSCTGLPVGLTPCQVITSCPGAAASASPAAWPDTAAATATITAIQTRITLSFAPRRIGFAAFRHKRYCAPPGGLSSSRRSLSSLYWYYPRGRAAAARVRLIRRQVNATVRSSVGFRVASGPKVAWRTPAVELRQASSSRHLVQQPTVLVVRTFHQQPRGGTSRTAAGTASANLDTLIGSDLRSSRPASEPWREMLAVANLLSSIPRSSM